MTKKHQPVLGRIASTRAIPTQAEGFVFLPITVLNKNIEQTFPNLEMRLFIANNYPTSLPAIVCLLPYLLLALLVKLLAKITMMMQILPSISS